MKASQTLQNDEPTSTENKLRRAVDITPALIHAARPDGTWITLTGGVWIFLVSHSKTLGQRGLPPPLIALSNLRPPGPPARRLPRSRYSYKSQHIEVTR